MPAKRTRRLIISTLAVLVISIGIYIFIFKNRVSNIYEGTIEPTPFENIVLEKDTALKSSFPEKNLPADSSSVKQYINPASPRTQSSKNQWSDISTTTSKTSQDSPEKVTAAATAAARKGREIKASEIPLLHPYSSRVRLTTFFSKFKEGDYISGLEFANLYRRDPSIGKVAKGTICNFIEKNIDRLTRVNNSFVIQTTDANGVHMKFKIPFVEDLQVNIKNGAQVIIGETFTSKAPGFNKSILLPIQLQSIDIVNNGEQFPTNGYISGDYYFIDYSKTKMAYKLK
ncbi:hypothetical protein [Cytophaga aurantiaca]|uniref:hypothetical protein n=1 Tax=Cytophaga aurantiaca TaxID=29530 RepID=UPI00038074E4|nr:hypothetical protein [Cytophaga aurantiaca]